MRWDQRVTTAIPGCDGNDTCRKAVEGTEVLLRTGRLRPGGPDTRSLRPLGSIGRGGRLAFAVPHVAGGEYHLVARMHFDGGGTRLVAVSGTFRVVGSSGPVLLGCRNHSLARFPGAFGDRRNVVEGPLVLVGAAFTDAATIRRFGGNKFPLLLAAGHRVTIEIPSPYGAGASLAYGPFPDGALGLRDGYTAMTFTACARGKRPDSSAGARQVTFWSGFVLADGPRCVPLRIRVDGERVTRLHTLRLGVMRC